MSEKQAGPFGDLTPHTIISAAEEHLGFFLDGTVSSYPSYINRVFGVKDEDGRPYIIKFYRPDRWDINAIQEELDFIGQCAADEIPVVSPIPGKSGRILGDNNGILFAVYPLKAGRLFEAVKDEDWIRLGRLIARLHLVGEQDKAANRVHCHPETTAEQIRMLTESGSIHPACIDEFINLTSEIGKAITPLFDGIKTIRLHGDCHAGNILDRSGEGLLLIDFDDMMTGPAVQDLWLLLPDHFGKCPVETDLLLTGYREFRDLPTSELKLIEPLRFMRIIYYLSWCALQKDDHSFALNNPHWTEQAFWDKEIEDLKMQYLRIQDGSFEF